ncbi:bifunctional 2-polyprenyl-6-hydroxyphenol methylase/3-demethylubiquinol 3-O-methyltransferase UbiG [Nostoc sp. PCC 7107]|uniref:class I SAM-dependent methyltransferase n=1 Tax=Nostoc sp. PCC 7107 TaxID=317936 RepID=UPI00029EEFCC|nr:class I SAM-dependent methyltransferase [Nostoc sp. PCC 7107]AFY43930.1 Methyltransferase type 11 [Nostoc sp. PCC 7107]
MIDLIRDRLATQQAVERIVPEDELPGIVSIHLKRYQFAAGYCQGKKVLDAATGVGYGAAYLTQIQAVDSVVGIDIDPQAISYGQSRYYSDRLQLQIADVTQTDFTDSQFDVICSFETIEHLSNIPAYLQEMIRILKPLGVYIVSTPQVAKTNYSPKNPYHTVEFSRQDFQNLLKQYFSHVELYGQRRKQSELHYWLTRISTLLGIRTYLAKFQKLRQSANKVLHTMTFEEMSVDDILISPERIERASEIVAVCRHPLQRVNHV